MDPTLMYRSVVLNVAHNRSVQHIVTRRAWALARRFVAGTTVEEALAAIDALESEGVHGILDLLGEMVTSEAEVSHFTEKIREQIVAFGARPYPRYVSVKLTQIGLDLDFTLMLDAARSIVQEAKQNDTFVRIDMEDSPRVDSTLRAFRSLREEGFDNVGLVLQSCLRRTESDLQSLLDLRPNLRIVKGAYKEPAGVAFQDKSTVDAAFLSLVRTNLAAGNHTAIATHDERILEQMLVWNGENEIPAENVEFQMLYGIRRDLQRRLASEGHFVRAYVPFGTEWYPYFSRRIAERPENAWFVAKALLAG
jgi:proline dehydrogenase